jgi:hypothetical protein
MKTKLSWQHLPEILLVLVVSIPHVYAALTSPNSILDWFHIDDAYYYFQTARNFVEGNGLSFDGINPTNGFHPLWMLLNLPVFTLARIDLFLPLRALILLQAAFSVASGILMYRLCTRYMPLQASLLVALYWVIAPSVHFVTSVGGVEAGLNAFILTVFWYSLSNLFLRAQVGELHWREIAIVGSVGALSVLSRLDNLFIVGFTGIWVLARLWNVNLARAGGAYKSRGWIALSFGLPILLLLGVYLSWNVVNFGSPMPVSGQVKQWWGEVEGYPYGPPPTNYEDLYNRVFANPDPNTSPWYLVGSARQDIIDRSNQILLGIGLPAVMRTRWLLTFLAVLILLDRRFTFNSFINLSMPPLLVGCMAQILYYNLNHHVALRPWYWVGEIFFLVLIGGIFLSIVVRLIQKVRFGEVVSWGVSALLCVILISNFARYMLDLVPPSGEDLPIDMQRMLWLQSHTAEGDIIGMTGSGTTGYFIRGRTIVNLDGLINSPEYFASVKAGTAAEFLNDLGMDYVYGSPKLIEDSVLYSSMFSGHIELDPRRGSGSNEFLLWKFE